MVMIPRVQGMAGSYAYFSRQDDGG
jgi:hypothetical protein